MSYKASEFKRNSEVHMDDALKRHSSGEPVRKSMNCTLKEGNVNEKRAETMLSYSLSTKFPFILKTTKCEHTFNKSC